MTKGNMQKLLSNFLADPLLAQASLFGESRLISELNPISENYISKLIAWYLNLNEGHRLGDSFLRSLLFTLKNNEGEIRYFEGKKEKI